MSDLKESAVSRYCKDQEREELKSIFQIDGQENSGDQAKLIKKKKKPTAISNQQTVSSIWWEGNTGTMSSR